MAVSIGAAVIEWVGAATAAEITASTALTIAAFGVGAAVELAATVGLTYDEPAISGPSQERDS